MRLGNNLRYILFMVTALSVVFAAFSAPADAQVSRRISVACVRGLEWLS